jgi:hypothetical protein
MIVNIRGFDIQIDEEDYHFINERRWFIDLTSGRPRVVCNPKKDMKHRKLHRLIIDAPIDKEVDHINGDPLDNRKSNLRLATHSQNMFNRGKTKVNTSGFKGVSWDKRTGKWRICVNLGGFETPEKAHEIYKRIVVVMAGEFAKW